MSETLPLSEWLSQQPLPEEIKLNEDGSAYIAIEHIKPKLDYLSPHWSTINFHHFYTEMPVFDKAGNKLGTTLWASGSVELVVSFDVLIGNRTEPTFEERRVSGAATFDVQKYYPNNNWAATLLSLCIVSAAKELGTFFGKDLNKERLTIPTVTEKEKKKVDKLANTLKSITS